MVPHLLPSWSSEGQTTAPRSSPGGSQSPCCAKDNSRKASPACPHLHSLPLPHIAVVGWIPAPSLLLCWSLFMIIAGAATFAA